MSAEVPATNARRTPVLIVGGGLGGLSTALALAHHGIESHVLEKSPGFTELGAGLQVAPNASRILRELGVLEAAAQDAVWPRQLVLRDALTGQRITELDLGERFRQHFGAPYILMHRGDLLAALYEGCRSSGLVSLEANKDVTDIEDRVSSAAVACADGTTYDGEVVVAADGLWSDARKLVVDDELICAEYVAYRGVVDVSEVQHEPELDSMVMWVGPEMHFVQYGLRRRELYNQVAVFRSYQYDPDSDDWGGPDELEAHYAPMCAEIHEGLPLIWRDRRWPMFDREPTDTWLRNRLVLLGDAAHPMLQYIAQGACQAIEDAMTLAMALSAHPDDPDAALKAYTAQRVPRTARVQQSARLWGEICHIDGMGRRLRNALLGKRSRDDFDDVEWLYGGGPLPTGGE